MSEKHYFCYVYTHLFEHAEKNSDRFIAVAHVVVRADKYRAYDDYCS